MAPPVALGPCLIFTPQQWLTPDILGCTMLLFHQMTANPFPVMVNGNISEEQNRGMPRDGLQQTITCPSSYLWEEDMGQWNMICDEPLSQRTSLQGSLIWGSKEAKVLDFENREQPSPKPVLLLLPTRPPVPKVRNRDNWLMVKQWG